MIYLRLFLEFFKTGLFAVGGGQATIPFLIDMADKTGWFTRQQLADMIAVSESTPGPIGVNMATYVGYTTAGIPGSLAATIGLVFPSVVIILIVARILKKFRNSKPVEHTFYGIRPASAGLIAAALVSVMLLCLFDTAAFSASGKLSDLLPLKKILLFAALWIATNKIPKVKKLHPVFFIACSALVGILFSFA